MTAPQPNLAPDDLTCSQCGYSLYAQSLHAGCPECGYSVHASSLQHITLQARILAQSNTLLTVSLVCATRDLLLIGFTFTSQRLAIAFIGVVLACIDLTMVLPRLYVLCTRPDRLIPQSQRLNHWIAPALFFAMIGLGFLLPFSLLLLFSIPAIPLILAATFILLRAAVWALATQNVLVHNRGHTPEQSRPFSVHFLRAAQGFAFLGALLFGPVAWWGGHLKAWSDQVLGYYVAAMLIVSLAGSILIILATLKPALSALSGKPA